MKHLRESYKYILMITQFGLSFAMPLLLCFGGCWLLVEMVGLDAWIFFPGIILGLGASCVTVYKFYLFATKPDSEERETRKNRKFYNKHV